MAAPFPAEVGGYILAGGRSSRMGREKALLELDGKPLIRHAVKKLRRVCVDVRILSSDHELEAYAPLVPDLHPGCGPMSGMEAALRHSIFEWNLFLAVDMPFLPTALLLSMLQGAWRTDGKGSSRGVVRVHMFEADGVPQPGFSMVHKDVAPFLTEALENGQYKLVPVLEAAARELAVREGALAGSGFWCLPLTSFGASARGQSRAEELCFPTEAQLAAFPLWFANVNTPDDFALAERNLDALDT